MVVSKYAKRSSLVRSRSGFRSRKSYGRSGSYGPSKRSGKFSISRPLLGDLSHNSRSNGYRRDPHIGISSAWIRSRRPYGGPVGYDRHTLESRRKFSHRMRMEPKRRLPYSRFLGIDSASNRAVEMNEMRASRSRKRLGYSRSNRGPDRNIASIVPFEEGGFLVRPKVRRRRDISMLNDSRNESWFGNEVPTNESITSPPDSSIVVFGDPPGLFQGQDFDANISGIVADESMAAG